MKNKIINILLLITILLLAFYAFFIEPNNLEVTNYKIKDKDLSGLKIVYASDFHIKPHQNKQLKNIVEKINARVINVVVRLLLCIALIIPYILPILISFFGSDFSILGQTVYTGREVLWENATKIIFEDVFKIHMGQEIPTTGMNYYGEEVLGAHNAFLEIAWRNTIFVSISFFVVLCFFIKKIYSRAKQMNIMPIVISICVVLLHMSTESTFFVGSFDYSLLILMPISIFLSKPTQEK